MHSSSEPTISAPDVALPSTAYSTPSVSATPRREARRYSVERGLVRRLRTAQANDDIGALALRHKLDGATREALAAELIKAGAPPITSSVAEAALARLVSFEPLNADALRPFIILSVDRSLRAQAMARIGDTMRSAGRSVRLVSDAVDTRENKSLIDAGKRLGCGITRYDGSPNCVEILRKTDLACLPIVEAGFRAPLDKVSLLRLNTLIQATGSEPVFVMRPEDASLAVVLSKIGLNRIVLVQTNPTVALGPVFAALRQANLSIAEIMHRDDAEAPMRPAQASDLATMLMADLQA